MKKQIELELLQVCGSPKLLGHKYTALLIYTLISNNMTTNYIYEGYQIVAEQYNVSAGSVERAINRYISAAWDLKRPELIAMFSEFRPSNKEFIAMFGVRIKIKLED